MVYSSFSLLLVHLWIGFVSCAVYHIVPSPDHHCPVESCLTLSSFAANTSLYLDNNTSLIFQPGNHTIHSKLNVTGVVNFSMISDQLRAGITCETNSKAGFTFNGVNYVHINNLKFYECYCDFYDLCDEFNIITLTASTMALVKCTFENNTGSITGMINAAHSNITVVQSLFKNNHLYDKFYYYKGKIIDVHMSNLSIYDTNFIGNKAEYGVILYVQESVVNTDHIMFKHNHGSVIKLISCEGDIYNSVFNSNEGALNLQDSKIQICGSEFKENFGKTYGGAIYCDGESLISFSETCTFTDNRAGWDGGAIYLANEAHCLVDHGATLIIANNVALESGGGMSFEGLTSLTLRSQSMLQIIENTASVNGGGIYLDYDSSLTLYSHCTFQILENTASNGGGIYSNSDSNLALHSQSMLQILKNTASENGGGIYIGTDSDLVLHSQSTLQILENTASIDGGGIYLDTYSNITLHSQSMLQILENRATNNGGGMYVSRGSSINLGPSFESHNVSQTSNSTIYFSGNQARKGGGLYLGVKSVVYIFPCLSNIINFNKNSADFGGAVHVAESPLPIFFLECFFHYETLKNLAQNYISNDTIKCSKKPIIFSLNRANYLGFSLYKDTFSKCSINGMSFDEFKLLSITSNIQTSDVGSALVQVCYCENGFPNCSRQLPYFNNKPGDKLNLDAAIVDERHHTVSGAIESEIKGLVQIRDDQKIQDVINGCTSLNFTITYAFEATQQLIMSPLIRSDSKYRGSERSIKINFLACINCPIGFQQIKVDARGCDCVCDVRKLGSHILMCNYTRETITKKSTTAWIGYLSVKNTSDYLIYLYCPMDYCFPPDVAVEINLNIPNGADSQCAHNHSGLLCGACSPGLSLSLGSSHCLPCNANWPGVLVAIIISSLLAGFILVASLLILNLTIATGTLNGLIFYANIVAANQHKFFPSTSFISVFVSWLNLELGVDTCFFDGMDFYWKTWIQLAFPAYILLLVALVIVISERSIKFAQIVGKRNPIATLNTLILLSYVNCLRTIFLAFSHATLDYPDGSHPVVWWPDATVGYFSGKHIVLWAAAVIILVAGIFYTAILFLWQWILYYQHKRIFKWIIRNQRLCLFVEPNHTPYAFKHRYWAGLLLLVRVIVYIVSTADVSSDHTNTLLAIGIITSFLTILVFSSRPYKSWPVQILEVICYLNITWFSLATFYVSKVGGKSQNVMAYISGTILLILFSIVLGYHVITEIFFATQSGKKLKNKLAQRFSDTETEEQVNLVVQNKKNDEPVTYSVVDPPTREEEPQPHPDIPKSRRDTTNNVSENADCEENELKPMEQKAAESSTPYILMK